MGRSAHKVVEGQAVNLPEVRHQGLAIVRRVRGPGQQVQSLDSAPPPQTKEFEATFRNLRESAARLL